MNRVAIAIAPDSRRLLVYGQTAWGESRPHPWLIPVDGSAPVALGLKRATHGLFDAADDTIVTVSWDNTISFWDARTGQVRQTFNVQDRVSAIAGSPDGKTLVVATRTGKVLLMDARSGQVVREVSHPATVNAVVVSPDSKHLATASDDRTAAVWNLATGEQLLSVPHDDEVWSVAFGADAGTLVTGGKDGALRLIALATGRQLQRLQFDGGIRHIAHRPGAPMLGVAVKGSDDDQAWTDVVIVDRQTGARIAGFEHNGHLNKRVFSPDGRTLVTAATNGELALWDTATGQLRHRPGVSTEAVAFSADGSRLIVGDRGRQAFILDAFSGQQLATIGEPGGILAVGVAPDGHTAVTFGQDGTLRGWDAVRGELVWSRPANLPGRPHIQFSGDGQRFASRSANGRSIDVGETRTGARLASVPADKRTGFVLSDDGDSLILERAHLDDATRPGHRYSEVQLWGAVTGKNTVTRRFEHGRVVAEAMPGGAVVIVAGTPGKDEPPAFVEVLDARTGARRWMDKTSAKSPTVYRVAGRTDVIAIRSDETAAVRESATGRIRFAGVGEQGRPVASLPHDGLIAVQRRSCAACTSNAETIELLDSVTGTRSQTFEMLGRIRDVQVSADGRRLFVALDGDERTGIWTWRAGDGSKTKFIEMDNVPRSMAPLSDPDLLVTYDFGQTLRVWRVSTGKEVHRLSHAATADGVAAASAADRVATWRGGSIRVWNTLDGSQLAHRLSHGDVRGLDISPDGRTVAYLTNRPHPGKRDSDFQALVLWEPDTDGEPVLVPIEAPNKVRFDPTGRWLAVSRNTSVQLVDVATLKPADAIPALPGMKLRRAEFSADGTRLFLNEFNAASRIVACFPGAGGGRDGAHRWPPQRGANANRALGCHPKRSALARCRHRIGEGGRAALAQRRPQRPLRRRCRSPAHARQRRQLPPTCRSCSPTGCSGYLWSTVRHSTCGPSMPKEGVWLR